MSAPDPDRLRRLLHPRTVAMVGGRPAELAVEQSLAIGYAGELWPVHPTRTSLAGVPTCFADVSQLPGVPDAALVAVNRERSIEVVRELAQRGVAGVVCYASGFAEDGEEGARLQAELLRAAGEMALIGPNCQGFVNYLDGAALWPEQQGGERVESGVAIIAQSGNITENLTMQRRSLPIATIVTIGNSARTGVVDLVEALLDDPRVTAIGLLEEIPEVAAFSRVAHEALRRRIPVVALKSGAFELGAQVTLSHTSSLADSDVLVDALFGRLGIARVHDLDTFLETLKLLHVHGSSPGTTIASASCSGGEAALLADTAQRMGLTMPSLPDEVRDRLHDVLGDRVSVRNPLDYHTYIWGDLDQLTECFTALLETGLDQHLLMLDFPRADRCDVSEFDTTVAAWAAAQLKTGARACVVSSLPESMPPDVAARLMAAGIAPMQGIVSCLAAISAAALIGAAQSSVEELLPLPPAPGPVNGSVDLWGEVDAKARLAAYGVPVPASAVVDSAEEAAASAAELGFPVVLKAVATGLAHKSEVGGVVVGLRSGDDVRRAAEGMVDLAERFLVERMVPGAMLELLVGVVRDPRLGLGLTIAAGGVLVELVGDSATLLLPVTAAEIRAALAGLRVGPVLEGFRGRVADLDAVVAAVEAITRFASGHADRLVEVEVNPLLVLPEGAMAVDALIRLAEPMGPEEAS